MENKYLVGNKCIFNTDDTSLNHLNGEKCTIERILTEDEVDIEDVGFMYELSFDSCSFAVAIAFEDELTAID